MSWTLLLFVVCVTSTVPQEGDGRASGKPVQAWKMFARGAQASPRGPEDPLAGLAPDRVHLFEHGPDDDRFPGQIWRLDPGVYDLAEAFPDDEVSAALVPVGMTAALFDETGLRGRYLLLEAGFHALIDHDYNDALSSLVVDGSAALELYEHSVTFDDRQGEVWRVPLAASGPDVDRFFEAPGDFGDDTLSTVRVPEGSTVILFDEASGEGLALVLKAGLHELDPLGFNDRVSAIRVLWSAPR